MLKYYKVALVLAVAAGGVRPPAEDVELGFPLNVSAEGAKCAGSALLQAETQAEEYKMEQNQYIAFWDNGVRASRSEKSAQLRDLRISLKCKFVGLYLDVTDQVRDDLPGQTTQHCVLVTCEVSGAILTEHLPCPPDTNIGDTNNIPSRSVSLGRAYVSLHPGDTWSLEVKKWILDRPECEDLLRRRNPFQLFLPGDLAVRARCVRRADEVKTNCISYATPHIKGSAFFWMCEQRKSGRAKEQIDNEGDPRLKIFIWSKTMAKLSSSCLSGVKEDCACGKWAETANCGYWQAEDSIFAEEHTEKLASKPSFIVGRLFNNDRYYCEQSLKAVAQEVLRSCNLDDDSFCDSSEIRDCAVQDALPTRYALGLERRPDNE